MLIDWHTNLWMPEHFGPEAKELTGRVSSNDGSPQAFERDVLGTADRAVIVTMNFPKIGLNVPNTFVAEVVAKHKDRVKGLACVDPMHPNAERDLEHAIRELGLQGLKISPVYGVFDPWCAEAGRLYRLCERLRVPLLWHQSAGFASQCALDWGRPALLDRIGREFPRLKQIVAHLGQPWMEEAVVLLRKHPQIYSDLSARFHRKWQLYHGLMVAKEYGVTGQLLFGSDFPVRSTAAAAAEFRALNDWGEGVRMPRFPDETIEEIISGRPWSLIWDGA